MIFIVWHNSQPIAPILVSCATSVTLQEPETLFTTLQRPLLRPGALMEGNIIPMEPEDEFNEEPNEDSGHSDTTAPSDSDQLEEREDSDCEGFSTVQTSSTLMWGDLPLDFKTDDVFLESSPSWTMTSNVDETSFMQRERSRSRNSSNELAEDTGSDGASSSSQDPAADDTSDPGIQQDDPNPVFNWDMVYSEMPFTPPAIAADSQGPTFDQISHALHLPLSELVAFYPVTHLMERSQEHIILIRCRGDRIHNTEEAMILFDVVCMDRTMGSSAGEGHHLFHSLHISRKSVTYDAFISTMRLTAMSRRHHDKLSIFVNGDLWTAADAAPRLLHHGDHVEAIFEEHDSDPYRLDLIDWLLGQGLALWPNILQPVLATNITPTIPFVAEEPSPPQVCSSLSRTAGRRFVTWYLSHSRFPHCDEGRIIVLDDFPYNWKEVLERTWPDRFDSFRTFSISWITPQPPQIDRLGYPAIPHLLIEQHHSPSDSGVLVTLVSHCESIVSRQEAAVVASTTAPSIYLRVLEVEFACALHYDCVITMDHYILAPDHRVRRPPGQSLVVSLQPRRSAPSEAAAAVSLTQTSRTYVNPQGLPAVAADTGSTSSALSLTVPVSAAWPCTGGIIPLEEHPTDVTAFRTIGDMAEYSGLMVQDPHVTITVSTYFLSPVTMPICPFPRYVDLSQDARTWRATLVSSWRDLLDPLQPVELFVVQPTPTQNPMRGAPIVAFILLVQDRGPQDLPYLATLGEDGHFIHIAQIITTEVTLRQVICALGLGRRCYCRAPEVSCHVLHGLEVITDDEPYTLPPGANLLVGIQRLDESLRPLWAQAVADLREQAPPHDPIHSVPLEQDSATFLQKASSVRPIAGVVAHAQQPEVAFPPLPSSWFSPKPLCLAAVVPPPPGSVGVILDSQDRKATYLAPDDLLKHGPAHIEWPHPKGGVLFLFIPHVLPSTRLFICDDGLSSLMDQQPLVLWAEPFDHPRAERNAMCFLCAQGLRRAVILSVHRVRPNLEIVRFVNSVGQEAPRAAVLKEISWPEQLPISELPFSPLWSVVERPSSNDRCFIQAPFDDTYFEHLRGGQLQLQRTLPDIPALQPLIAHLDPSCLVAHSDIRSFHRLVIYTDGSASKQPRIHSQTSTADRWCFVVLGERYDEELTLSVNLIGWCAAHVCYTEEAPTFWGTKLHGSDQAEREALLWASFWRCALGCTTPTTFVSDSSVGLGICQGTAALPPSQVSAQLLRGMCQCLEQGLGASHLSFHHTHGHSGDTWNEVADIIAGQPDCCPLESFENVDLNLHKNAIPHWWMATANGGPTAGLTTSGFLVPAPSLPKPDNSVEDPASHVASLELNLNFTTANVNSMYSGECGCAGKLGFLTEQFSQYQLLIIGLQEARTPRGSFTTGPYIRLCSGGQQGQGGLELWLSTQIPYATSAQGPLYFARNHCVVVEAHDRHFLCYLTAPGLQLWILVGHAPHTGKSPEEISDWWSSMTALLHKHDVQGHLVVLVDANASMGHPDGRTVRTKGTSSSPSTPYLRDFAATWDLCITGSLPVHQGTQSTWTTPDGLHSRDLDHVLLSSGLADTCVWSGVMEDIDITGGHVDHDALCAQCHLASECLDPARKQRPSIDRLQIKGNTHLFSQLRDIQPSPWSTDIEEEIRSFNSQSLDCLRNACKPARHLPKKPYITAATWHLRECCQALASKLRVVNKHFHNSVTSSLPSWCQPVQIANLDLAGLDVHLCRRHGRVAQVRFGPQLPAPPLRPEVLEDLNLDHALTATCLDLTEHLTDFDLTEMLASTIERYVVTFDEAVLTMKAFVERYGLVEATHTGISCERMSDMLHRLQTSAFWKLRWGLDVETTEQDKHTANTCERAGDFQQYLERLHSELQDITLVVVSVDIVANEEWGDVARDHVRSFWVTAIRSGRVAGLLAGPPCETWSIARSQELAGDDCTAPRPVRAVADLWGSPSLRLTECLQVLLGNVLLAFTLEALAFLYLGAGIGLMEHPACPLEPDAPSVWKLPIVLHLLQLPGFRLRTVQQGRYGSRSAKPTSLLTLNLGHLDAALEEWHIDQPPYEEISIGRDASGTFLTGRLKEYPPAFCAALSTAFYRSFEDRPVLEGCALPSGFLSRCKAMQCGFSAFIGRDFAGA
eukprot:Skav218908  [mRNA]  locus=scaffold328:451778:460747:- [translate_table: standard]